MLLDPEQRRKLQKLAQSQGKSVAEITREAIDAGLAKMVQNDRQEHMKAALEAARRLRDSMPLLDIDVVADIHQMREERDDELSSRD
jgi:predicted DNA-binding protein